MKRMRRDGTGECRNGHRGRWRQNTKGHWTCQACVNEASKRHDERNRLLIMGVARGVVERMKRV